MTVTRLWGMDAIELHDRYWAGHGVAVVRPGSPAPMASEAPALLVGRDDLVLCDARPMMGRLLRGGCRMVRLSVIEPDREAYGEAVIADEADRLVAIRRRYTPPVRNAVTVYLTRDRSLIESWCRSDGGPHARHELRVAAGLRGERTTTCVGRFYDAADDDANSGFLRALHRRWRDLSPLGPRVWSPRPGVWVHETVRVDPGARIVAPAWIGAGVHLAADETVVGPCVLADRIPVSAAPRAIIRPTTDAGGADAADDERRQPLGRRIFDIVFSLAVLAVTAPIFPLIMLAIWLEDGRPFLFVHQRQTLGGRHFSCYKFRTMYRDADRMKSRLRGLNACDGPQFHIENDPRLLRVGRWLRRFHLDELPQFVNVLLGHMSVIGPRPSPDNENQFCPAWRDARLSVKPGVTGLWQVARTRAPKRDFEEWIRHDLDYVERQSWHLDLRIMYRTVGNIFERVRRSPVHPTSDARSSADDHRAAA